MIELKKRINIADLALKLRDEWIDRFPESESLTLTFERINNNAVCKYDVLEITVDGDRIGQIVILPTAICDFHGETETGKERGNGALERMKKTCVALLRSLCGRTLFFKMS